MVFFPFLYFFYGFLRGHKPRNIFSTVFGRTKNRRKNITGFMAAPKTVEKYYGVFGPTKNRRKILRGFWPHQKP